MADYSITAANVVAAASGTTVRDGTAGASITQGDVLYKDLTDSSHLKPADCTSETGKVACGIALNSAEDGQPVDYIAKGTLTIGVTTGTVLAAGDVLVLSTSGAMSPAADLTTSDYAVLIGVGQSTTQISINIGTDTQADAVIA